MVNTADNGNALNGTGPLSAGVLAFAPDGTLFVGDSKGGAIWAYPPRARGRVPEAAPFLFANIDERMAELLGVETRQLAYNGLAVHPLTREPHTSLGIKAGGRIEAAVVRGSLEGTILPLNSRIGRRPSTRSPICPNRTKSFARSLANGRCRRPSITTRRPGRRCAPWRSSTSNSTTANS